MLRTNTNLPMREVALRYKELWQAGVPHREIAARHTPHLPQMRRDHPRPRVLLVPRPADAEGAVPAHG
ncbi:MAG: hypothetical protein OXF26_03120, partial [Alphaproteobacteria bacterium]|nr:hypothetical protein [Alphaproteobacteria bacterium]